MMKDEKFVRHQSSVFCWISALPPPCSNVQLLPNLSFPNLRGTESTSSTYQWRSTVPLSKISKGGDTPLEHSPSQTIIFHRTFPTFLVAPFASALIRLVAQIRSFWELETPSKSKDFSSENKNVKGSTWRKFVRIQFANFNLFCFLLFRELFLDFFPVGLKF